MNSSVVTRTRRASAQKIQRFIEAGDLTLDLLHRDGRVEDRWLDLHPREFDLLWRLAQTPRQRLSNRELLEQVWPIPHEPTASDLATNVASVRAKLGEFGLGHMLLTHPEGGYYFDPPPGPSVFHLRRDKCIESVG